MAQSQICMLPDDAPAPSAAGAVDGTPNQQQPPSTVQRDATPKRNAMEAEIAAREVQQQKREREERTQQAIDWVKAHPESARPQEFFVTDGGEGALADPLIEFPAQWQDLLDRPVKFEPENRRFVGPGNTEAAVQAVKRVASLARFLDIKALAHIDGLENSLVLNEALGPAQRAKIREQLKRLLEPGRPFWENWVRNEDPRRHHKFDLFVFEWLRSPVDPADLDVLVPTWMELPFEEYAAAEFFGALPPVVREQLGVVMHRAEGVKRKLAFLSPRASLANELSREIGCGIRFRAVL